MGVDDVEWAGFPVFLGQKNILGGLLFNLRDGWSGVYSKN